MQSIVARLFCAALVLVVLAGRGEQAVGQGKGTEERIKFKVSVVPNDPFDPSQALGKNEPMAIRRGQVVKVIVEGDLQPGFHTYPLTTRTARQQEMELWKYRPSPSKDVALLWPVQETPPDLVEVVENKVAVTKYEHRQPFTWVQEVVVLPEATPGEVGLPIKLKGMVCDEHSCKPFNVEVKAMLNVSAEAALPLDARVNERRSEQPPPPTVVTVNGQEALPAAPIGSAPDKTVAAKSSPGRSEDGIYNLINSSEQEYKKAMEDLAANIVMSDSAALATDQTSDLLAFVLAGIFWGAISLVTPCVFPMIPITVSFFLKQSEKEHHRPVTMALVYSGTIVIVLTLAAAFLLSVFRWLSVNPIMNYGLGFLFIYFALSLFGMYEIELPSGLARFTSAHEGQGGLVGTMFMALTFTIISFACVAPFLGGFGGTAAGVSRPVWHNLFGGLAFSVTFAAPFFFLALFPTLLRKMPKSGSWLNSVKVVMGFLELAAAIKFFRSAELVMTGSEPWLFTFDFSLGIYVALAALCSLYLLNIFRLPHDTPEESLSVPRMLFAVIFLALALHLVPALFKDGHGANQRPHGTIYAWVDSFLLPDAKSAKEEPSSADLPTTLAQAREQLIKTKKPQRIFIDFTGLVCTNCRLNEENVFPKPNISELLHSYRVVKIYTDTMPANYYSGELRASFGRSTDRQEADAAVNEAFQAKIFGTTQLPLYVVVEPREDGKVHVLGVYPEGRINNVAAFADFLRDPK